MLFYKVMREFFCDFRGLEMLVYEICVYLIFYFVYKVVDCYLE